MQSFRSSPTDSSEVTHTTLSSELVCYILSRPRLTLIPFIVYEVCRSLFIFAEIRHPWLHKAITLSALLVEYVSSTSIGHSTEGALARKDKRPLPIPVRITKRTYFRSWQPHLVLLLAVPPLESVSYVCPCLTSLIRFVALLHIHIEGAFRALSLSYWFSRSNFQKLVVRHAICCGSAWYACVPAIPLHLDSLMCLA
jgi:hypothetical protein